MNQVFKIFAENYYFLYPRSYETKYDCVLSFNCLRTHQFPRVFLADALSFNKKKGTNILSKIIEIMSYSDQQKREYSVI